jgi:hypothetical protein
MYCLGIVYVLFMSLIRADCERIVRVILPAFREITG